MVLGEISASEFEHGCVFKELHDQEQMMQRQRQELRFEGSSHKDMFAQAHQDSPSLFFLLGQKSFSIFCGTQDKWRGEAYS